MHRYESGSSIEKRRKKLQESQRELRKLIHSFACEIKCFRFTAFSILHTKRARRRAREKALLESESAGRSSDREEAN